MDEWGKDSNGIIGRKALPTAIQRQRYRHSWGSGAEGKYYLDEQRLARQLPSKEDKEQPDYYEGDDHWVDATNEEYMSAFKQLDGEIPMDEVKALVDYKMEHGTLKGLNMSEHLKTKLESKGYNE